MPKSFLSHRFQKFVKARTPRARESILNQKRIYIVPSKAGLALLVLFLLLMLLGINFQNNLVFVIAFWLLALLVVNILYTYRNLSGLVIRAANASPAFNGDRAQFSVEIADVSGRLRSGIQIGWPGEDQQIIELQPNQTLQLRLTLPTSARGWCYPERMTILTRYPTGLARAWSYVLPDMRAMVYPAPILMPQHFSTGLAQDQDDLGKEIRPGSTDYSGVRAYQPGDSMKQIHWPQLAKTGQLASREFVDYQSEDQWLDLNKLAGNNLEQKLSHLCARVLELHGNSTSWGLILLNQKVELGQGEQHKNQCLAALALFGIAEDESYH